MHYGPTSMMNTRRPKLGRNLLSGIEQFPVRVGGSRNAQSRGSQNAQRSYERYLALAHSSSPVWRRDWCGELLPAC